MGKDSPSIFEGDIPIPKRFEETGMHIHQSDRMETSFDTEASNTLPQQIIEYFRTYGVSQEDINVYKDAIKAFLRRGSLVVKEGYHSFRPQDSYFGPEILFQTKNTLYDPNTGEEVQVTPYNTFPDILHTLNLKPRLQRQENSTKDTSSLVPVPVDGQEVLRAFEQPDRIDTQMGKVSPGEQWLVQLNRLMYALHEPLHIAQGAAPGDNLSLWKEKFDAHGIFDPAKEQAFIHEGYKDSIPAWKEDEKFSKTIWCPPDGLPLGEENKINVLIANNEMTMDILSQRVVAGYLREQPALLLNTHNTVVSLVEAMRCLSKQKDTTEDIRAVWKKIKVAVGFFLPVYFSAFESSQEAHQYFEEKKTFLGKEVGGNIAVTEDFDEIYVLNLFDDIKIQMDQAKDHGDQPVREYQFSDGQTHKVLDGRKQIKPLSKRGLELSTSLVDKVLEKGEDSAKLGALLKEIEEVGENFSEDNLEKVQKKLKSEYEIELSAEDIKDMYGISTHFFSKALSDENYPKHLVVRKHFFSHMEKTHPEQVRPLVSSLFFESHLSLNEKDFQEVTGLLKEWEHIQQETQLGMVSLDVTKLSLDQRSTLKLLYDQAKDKYTDKMFLQEALQVLVELKRGQIASP